MKYYKDSRFILQQVGQAGFFWRLSDCPKLNLKCAKCNSRGHEVSECNGAKRFFNFIDENTAELIQRAEEEEEYNQSIEDPPQTNPTTSVIHIESTQSQATSDSDMSIPQLRSNLKKTHSRIQ